MWRTAVTPHADEFLDDLYDNIRERIMDKVDWLVANVDSVKHRQLFGSFSDFYKLRVGDYRVLYRMNREKELVRIEDIDHRSEIYE